MTATLPPDAPRAAEPSRRTPRRATETERRSRYVSDAIGHALALTRSREIVEAYEDEHGPFTPEEIEEARRAWHGG
ncbi:hypothetical protein JNUCC64_16415 [Streptomyces sp. JNUCC 64]